MDRQTLSQMEVQPSERTDEFKHGDSLKEENGENNSDPLHRVSTGTIEENLRIRATRVRVRITASHSPMHGLLRIES